MRSFALLVLLVIIVSSSLSAQDYESSLWMVDDSTWVMELRDSNNVHLGHYALVTQYFEHAGVSAIFGEVNLRGSSGDTLNRPLDHPLNFMNLTPELLVYDTNATTFANPIQSKRFVFTAGDTLFYILSPSFSFRVYWPGTDSIMTVEEDTALFAITDSVLFIVELVDDASNSVVATLDSIMYVPISEFYQIENSIIGIPTDSTVLNLFERRWIPTSAFITGAKLFLRLRPVYIPQLRNDYHDRVMYAKFYWEGRYSSYYRDWARSVGLMKSASSKAEERHPHRSVAAVSPSMLSLSNLKPIQVYDTWDGSKSIMVRLFDELGRVIWQTELAPSESNKNGFVLYPDFRDTVGVYFLQIVQGDLRKHAKIITY